MLNRLHIHPYIILFAIIVVSALLMVGASSYDSAAIHELKLSSALNIQSLETARTIPIAASVIFLFLIYIFAKRLVGSYWALLSTSMIAFSPAFLAYGHYLRPEIFTAIALFLIINVALYLLPYITYRKLPSHLKSIKALAWAVILIISAAIFAYEWQRAHGFSNFIANDIDFWINYFFKESIAWIIVTALGLGYLIARISREGVKIHFEEITVLVILLIYKLVIVSESFVSMGYILPMLPFIYILASAGIKNFSGKFTAGAIAMLIVFHSVSLVFNYPNFAAYTNKLEAISVSAMEQIKILAEYDLGQDLKRLQRFSDENNIQAVALDYYGEDNPQDYLNEKYIPWKSSYSKPQEVKSDYLAISLRRIYDARRKLGVNETRSREDEYLWLKNIDSPYAKIGTIWVYKLTPDN